MQSDYQLSLRDYIGVVRRRGVLIISVFGVVFALAVAIAIMMPPVYQSTGTIMVESQQIPDDLVQATVTSYADERIEIIKQRVMTRDNLFRIAKKYQLFADSGLSFTPSEAVDEMRSRIGVELVNANVQARQRATIAFKVSFEHRRPDLAQRVANELVTLFLDENVKVRTERATQTTVFLTQEADKLRTDLDKLESQIATYKMQHGGALPDNMTLTMNSMQRMETELRDTERDQRAAQDELRGLEIELASAKAGIGIPGSFGAQNAQQELVKARADLARVAAIYTENHPDVRALKRKIEGLEKTVAEEKSTGSGGNGAINSAADLQVARLESRVAFLRSQIGLLDKQQASLRGKIGQLERQILQAPQVERGMADLLRDQETARRKYEEIRSKQMSAQVAENLEDEQKAERFTLLEPPLAPDVPIKPNRKKMIALGFFLAVACSIGAVILLETLNGRVRGVEAVSAIVGQRPIVTIPYITVAAELQQRRKIMVRAGVAVAVIVPLLLLAVHFLYMPLDMVLSKVLVRLS